MSACQGRAACDGDRSARRAARAALIVAAGIAFLAISDAAHAQAVWRMTSESSSFAGFDAVMGTVDDGFACSPSDVPEVFKTELLPVARRRGLRCNPESRLVGFDYEGSAFDALREVRDALERGGWRTTAAGEGSCATFAKGDGACRWAFVQCVQMAQGSSVVVQWSECGKEGLS